MPLLDRLVGSGLDAAGDLMQRVGSQFASDALLRFIADRVRADLPDLLASARGELLAAIAGAPPAGFADALERVGLGGMPTEAMARMWRAAIDAASERVA